MRNILKEKVWVAIIVLSIFVSGLFISDIGHYFSIKHLLDVNKFLIDELIRTKMILADLTISITDSIQQVVDNNQLSAYWMQSVENRIKEVDYNKILNSSVVVACLTGEGSGTVIKKVENGFYVLTCNHVISDIAKLNKATGLDLGVSVGYPKYDKEGQSGGKVIYAAKIIKYDEKYDLALLKVNIDDESLTEIKLAEHSPLKGDVVYSVGNPLGLIRTVSKGIIANYEETNYVFDGTITFGNSGGGLFNKNGELIGVPASVLVYGGKEDFAPESGLGMAINLITIKKFLEGVEY